MEPPMLLRKGERRELLSTRYVASVSIVWRLAAEMPASLLQPCWLDIIYEKLIGISEQQPQMYLCMQMNVNTNRYLLEIETHGRLRV